MITKEHLEHWIKELRYALNGIGQEVGIGKVETNGIKLPNGKFVSFEYIAEKVGTIGRTIDCIDYDILKDGTGLQDDIKGQLDNIDIDVILEYVLKNYFEEIKERVLEASRP